MTSEAVELLKAIKYAINEQEAGQNFILRRLSIDVDHLVSDRKVQARLHRRVKSASTFYFHRKSFRSTQKAATGLRGLEEVFALLKGHKSVINYSNEKAQEREGDGFAASDAEKSQKG